MAIDLTKLSADLIDKLQRTLEACRVTLEACRVQGIEMRPYNGLRTPLEQAKLWRQSRTSLQIRRKIEELRDQGALYLSSVIQEAGPQHGPEVTRAIPGFSWHQWGEAVDCFWAVDGDAEWSTTRKINGLNGYKVYAEEAKKIGLTPGGLWTSFKDWPHVQLRAESNPGQVLSQQDINDEMERRFG
jgi:peptidoglycan LD-endopeptidase CwlK